MPESDLVTIGGDLQPSTLIHAYRRGIFPMEVTGLPGVLGWWSPDPRGILPLDALRVTRSMRQSARRFEIRVDTSFGGVIRCCADPSREQTEASARKGALRRCQRRRWLSLRSPPRLAFVSSVS